MQHEDAVVGADGLEAVRCQLREQCSAVRGSEVGQRGVGGDPVDAPGNVVDGLDAGQRVDGRAIHQVWGQVVGGRDEDAAGDGGHRPVGGADVARGVPEGGGGQVV